MELKNINRNANNLLDGLGITSIQMQNFLNSVDEIQIKLNSIEIIEWMWSKCQDDELFVRCMLMNASLGVKLIRGKIQKAADLFVDEIIKNDKGK